MKKLLAVLLAVALLLSGCGGAADVTEAPTTETTTAPTEPPMDAQTLMDRMIAASEGKIASQMTMNLVMDAQVDMKSMDMAFGMYMDMTMDMVMQAEPLQTHMAIEMNIETMGEKTAQIMQMYGTMENDIYVTYVHDETTDTWVRSENTEAMSSMDSMEADLSYLEGIPMDRVVLEEATQQIEGREVYVLHYSLTGDQLDEAGMGDMLSAAGMNDLDFAGLEVPYTAYVDCEDFLAVRTEIDLSNAGNLMNSAVTSLIGASQDAAELDMDIQFEEFSASVSNICYDPVEVPAVPEEGIVKSQRGTPYPIEEADVRLNVYAPAGFSYIEGEYYMAGFVNEEQTHAVYATLYTDAEFTEYLGIGDAESFGLYEDCVDVGAGPELEGWYTMYGIQSDGLRLCYAWIQVGGCKLVVDSADYLESSDMDEIFAIMINMVDIP